VDSSGLYSSQDSTGVEWSRSLLHSTPSIDSSAKVKTFIPDDELGNVLGELLLVRIRLDPQLALLRHFHTACLRAIESHHHHLLYSLTLLAATTKLPEQQKTSSSTALSTDFCLYSCMDTNCWRPNRSARSESPRRSRREAR
jgi:hypothetical protein